MNTDILERETQDYLKSLTVLFVEDEEVSRGLCSEFLSRLVGVLVTAQNGVEGLEAWRQHKPDIIVTDVQMPVMDGLSMVDEIRSRDMTVPIIVLTAFDNGDYLMKSINFGIDKYVTKPVDSGRLQSSLVSCAHRLLVEKQLKHSQVALERKQQRLANIIEGTQAGTWEHNVQTGEIEFNERVAELIGYRLDEISPSTMDSWRTLFSAADAENSRTIMEKHLCGEADCYECENRLWHKNGYWVWILSRGRIMSWSDDGKPLWVFGTHLDITALKKAEIELQMRNDLLVEERDRLAAAMAQIKRLEGIIPICAYCKKIRDDQQSWNQLEEYISNHSEAKFSHGICPDCFEKEMVSLKKFMREEAGV